MQEYLAGNASEKTETVKCQQTERYQELPRETPIISIFCMECAPFKKKQNVLYIFLGTPGFTAGPRTKSKSWSKWMPHLRPPLFETYRSWNKILHHLIGSSSPFFSGFVFIPGGDFFHQPYQNLWMLGDYWHQHRHSMFRMFRMFKHLS